MVEIRQTPVFDEWFRRLRDQDGKARILVRLRRLSLGNPGDVQPVGQGGSEMRIHSGPGYRIYFVQRGQELVILLAGGDKSTQTSDIRRALALASEVLDGQD